MEWRHVVVNVDNAKTSSGDGVAHNALLWDVNSAIMRPQS